MNLLCRVFEFAAAHRLFRPEWSLERNIETFGKCAYKNGHGHNYKLEVRVSGSLDPISGMVIEANKLAALVSEYVLTELDHKNLDMDVAWFQGKTSTVENLVEAIWGRLETPIKSMRGGIWLEELVLWETSEICAIKRRA